ncbi:hypothetical protein ACFL2H_13730, partial [Planctomycetota bacterium]
MSQKILLRIVFLLSVLSFSVQANEVPSEADSQEKPRHVLQDREAIESIMVRYRHRVENKPWSNHRYARTGQKWHRAT